MAWKETFLVFAGKSAQILQAQAPDTGHLGVFHEGLGHFADGGGGGILGGDFGDAGAAVHFLRKVKDGEATAMELTNCEIALMASQFISSAPDRSRRGDKMARSGDYATSLLRSPAAETSTGKSVPAA